VVKGPAADTTNAPQPWGSLCNPVMKMMMIIIFCPFPIMEHRWNEIDRRKPVPVPLCPRQIPHGLTRDRTRASAVRGRRLTAWAMARPYVTLCVSYSYSLTRFVGNGKGRLCMCCSKLSKCSLNHIPKNVLRSYSLSALLRSHHTFTLSSSQLLPQPQDE
jgi:hypothetical protein